MKKFIYSIVAFIVIILPSYLSAEDKHFVVVIPSYNNAGVYQKNLDSLFNQNYDNWHAIYIDDVSSDETGELVEQYVYEKGFDHKVTVIRNSKRSLAMANLYRAIITANDDHIIVTLDGDDWFADNEVLNLLNDVYQDPNVWLTYGSYTDWPEPEPHVLQHWQENLGGTLGNRPIPSHIIEKNLFRAFIGCTGQLRTFYAWLFKQIKIEDLMYQSDFLPMTYDVGIMLPLHELAGGRFKFIKKIIYIHNLDTPLNDHKVDSKLQGNLEIMIRKKKKYQRLAESKKYYFEQFKDSKADLIVFSYDRPMQLYAFLESTKKYVSGINSIQVIYKVSSMKFDQAYEIVKKDFPQAIYIKEPYYTQINQFKTLTMKTINNSSADHVIFAVDDIIIKDYVDLTECIQWLEKTHAYGFYLKMGTHLSYCFSEGQAQPVPVHTQIYDTIHAWQFEYGTCDWNYPHTVDMTLYRKKDIVPLFETLHFSNPNWLEGRWAEHRPLCNVGLFYENSKIVNLPINKVTTFDNQHMDLFTKEELLEAFEKGYKIDISPLFQVKNNDVHMEYEPNFMVRVIRR